MITRKGDKKVKATRVFNKTTNVVPKIYIIALTNVTSSSAKQQVAGKKTNVNMRIISIILLLNRLFNRLLNGMDLIIS